jgi:hypothetical protein
MSGTLNKNEIKVDTAHPKNCLERDIKRRNFITGYSLILYAVY